MIITLKDGSKREYAEAKSVIDIASDISEGLARVACAGAFAEGFYYVYLYETTVIMPPLTHSIA